MLLGQHNCCFNGFGPAIGEVTGIQIVARAIESPLRTIVENAGGEGSVVINKVTEGKKDFGFIAQEVRELDNDTLRLVYAENEDKLEMSYGKLVPILVKAIQELKEEVELLKG